MWTEKHWESEKQRLRSLKHGAASFGVCTPEYSIWSALRQRCNNPNNPRYADYGGRGITVCSKWNNFAVFLSDVGPRPSPQHQINRVDNDRPYEPGNVEWTTAARNMRNRRNTFRVDGIPVADLAEQYGLPRNTLGMRLRAGWPLAVALSTPVRSKMPDGAGRARDLPAI
jgi:hypothetical protein